MLNNSQGSQGNNDLQTAQNAIAILIDQISKARGVGRTIVIDKNWLNNELKVQGYKKVDDIFIAVLDSSGTLNVFTVGEGKQKNDIYE